MTHKRSEPKGHGLRYLTDKEVDKWIKGAVTRKGRKKKGKRAKNRQFQKSANRNKEFYQSFEWRKVRYEALKANNGCCELCGRSKLDGAVLHVDHIKPLKTHWHLRLLVTNLQVLCALCNHGKGNWDQTDWREPRLSVLMGESI